MTTAKILCEFPAHSACIPNLKLKLATKTKLNQQQRSAFLVTKFFFMNKQDKSQIFKNFLQQLKNKKTTKQTTLKIPQQKQENLLDWAQKYQIIPKIELFTNFNILLS